MNQNKSKNTLINWEIVSVNPNEKIWNWKDLFCFWGNNLQSVIAFSLITSLYLVYELSLFVVLFGSLIGSFFVYFFANLIGKPSVKSGLPFPVILRASLGIKGAMFFSFLRGLVGIFMFGIQTYFLSKALVYLIRIGIFSYDASLLDKDILLTFFLGLNIIDWFAISITMIIQGFLFSSGMILNKKLIKFSAISVYLGMIIFFFSVLLNDVKISSNAFISFLDYSNFLDKSNLAPLITVIGTTFAFFSIIILSYGDFSRYVKDENQLKKGNLSLLLNLIIFSFFTLFIVTGADAFLKQDPENLNRILTSPNDIIGKLESLLVIILVLFFVIIASASTNLIANFIPSQYSLINFIPSSLTFKSSSFIIVILGFLVSIFWLTYFSQIGALSYIDTISAFFGPLFGLIIADFYFVKKEKLINKDIYSLETNGSYYYSGGWHIKGVYALFLGFVFSASTIWNSNLMFLQSYSWIIGAFISFIVYYLLVKD